MVKSNTDIFPRVDIGLSYGVEANKNYTYMNVRVILYT